MANTAQAKKRARQGESRRKHNVTLRSEFRTAVKKVRKAIATGDKVVAANVLRESVSAMDRIADKKIVQKNAAARHKSRLSAAIKGMS